MKKSILLLCVIATGCASKPFTREDAASLTSLDLCRKATQRYVPSSHRPALDAELQARNESCERYFAFISAERQEAAQRQAAANALLMDYAIMQQQQTNALNRQSRPIQCRSSQAGIYTNTTCQ